MIVAISGPAGSGKSTAAAHVEELHGFARVRFAAFLKAMTRAFLQEAGTPASIVERMIEGDLKEVPSALLCGRTPRFFMQRLGHEFGRELIGADLWTNAWEAKACAVLAKGAPGVLAEDCRYPNEAEAARRLGGVLVAIERPSGTVDVGAHASEGQALPVDARIVNSGTVAELLADLDGVLGRAQSVLG